MSAVPDYKSRIKHGMDEAIRYSKRKQSKHRAEMALIEKGMACTQGVHTILDAPCGAGRASIWLARQGYQVTAIDLGEGALELTKRLVAEAGLTVAASVGDIEHMLFGDKAFDAVLCFRLYHHFDNPAPRKRTAGELCRVAKDYVLISYLSPWSVTSLRRKARNQLCGTPMKQHSTALKEVSGYFAAHGFDLVCDIAQTRFLHSLHLAIFKKPR